MTLACGALRSIATLVSVDICKRLKPTLSDSALVAIGRVTAAITLVISVAWSTQMHKFGEHASSLLRNSCTIVAVATAAGSF
jgi:SSS family solute:Na+ symporter